MAKDDVEAELANALAESLGVQPGNEEDGDNFFAEARKEFEAKQPPAEPEEPEVEETKEFVHGPTGKKFDNELDYLRYNSGWTADNLGKQNKELRERLEKLETAKAQPTETGKQPSKKDIMKQVWPNLKDDILDDDTMQIIFDGNDYTAGMSMKYTDSKIAALEEKLARLGAAMDEQSVRATMGVDPKLEHDVLEKHPYLAGLPAKERMAVIADLAGAHKASEKPSPKLIDKIPRQRAEDHVEQSAVSAPESFEDTLTAKFESLDDDKRVSALGSMFEKIGGFDAWRQD